MKPEPSIDSLDESMNDVPGLFLEEPNLRLMRFEWSGEILHASPTTHSPSLIEGIQEFRYRHIRMQSLVYPTHSVLRGDWLFSGDLCAIIRVYNLISV